VDSGQQPDGVRVEVRRWLDEHWRPGTPRREWLGIVLDAGYAVPTWPRDWYGWDATPEQALVIADEFRRVGAPGAAQDLYSVWASTLVNSGTETLKRRLVRPVLMGEVAMCLLYSEPGAGSDLAGLQTRADRDGDEWTVTGQKVWTSGGHVADYGLLLARTNWDVPKHQGISFFWFPMKQPGVEVRPIKQITGESHFNEVFIDGARVPSDHLLGGLDQGWRVLQAALAVERSIMGDVARGPRSSKEGPARENPMEPDAGISGEVDLAALARAFGRSTDPVIRQAITRIYMLRAVNRWNALRAKAQLERSSSSPVLSLGKLAMSRILHEGAQAQSLIVGADTMLTGGDHPDGDAAGFMALNAFFTSIGGGTDQIQRNIIGERVLGLPREPEVDRDVPFRDVTKATVTR
jgi:alkylation response protein AidB-like acyl-CoA dehydrogenase